MSTLTPELAESLRNAAYDVEVRANIAAVYSVPNAADAAVCATDALAAWGMRAPDAIADGTWLEQVAETGVYRAFIGRLQLTVRRAP